MEYIIENTLPVFEEIPNTVTEDSEENGEENKKGGTLYRDSTNVNQAELLKTLAELSVFCGVMDDLKSKLECLLKCLLVSSTFL